MTEPRQLQKISDLCAALGADVRYGPEARYLTVLAWEHDGERRARFIQQQIRKQAANDPGLACYCFDLFSTLVYMI